MRFCQFFRIRLYDETRVKSSNFGHPSKFVHTFANSGNPDKTAPNEPSHQDFHCLLS